MGANLIASPILQKRINRRLLFFLLIVLTAYGLLFARMLYFGLQKDKAISREKSFWPVPIRMRPDIVDRNGNLLAKDIKIYSLYARSEDIFDPAQAALLLHKILPHFSIAELYKKFTSKKGFIWIERGLTPRQKEQILALGIEGLDFKTEIKRFYPHGNLAAHILGYVDIDNRGLAGMEKYLDKIKDKKSFIAKARAQRHHPFLQLSLDLRVQNALQQIVKRSIERYKALAAGAVLVKIKTGEIIAMASLPDFDPNQPASALQKDRLNRITGAVYEMGSTIKGLTTAFALSTKKFTLDSLIDAAQPLAVGHKMFIHDYYGKDKKLSVADVFIYSSNIGSAQEVLQGGLEEHKEFLRRSGILQPLDIELPEIARPVLPSPWRKANSMTIAFGHGLMTTPLQLTMATAAILNDGIRVKPSFLKKEPGQIAQIPDRLVSPEISREMRYLFKLNAAIGSARYARVAGYRVGGKTGTAEKVEHGKYVANKRFNSFLAAFPMDDPQYILCTIIDEPQIIEGQKSATAAMNAAPMAREIIERSAVFLNIEPDFAKEALSKAP